MKKNKIYRLAGIMGLVACIIAFAEFPLWMIGGTCPPFYHSDAFAAYVSNLNSLWITRSLMDMVLFILLLFFLAGFRKMMVSKRKDLEFFGTIFMMTSIIYVTIQLIADSISGSIGLDAFHGQANPIVIRTMVEITLLMYGSMGLVLTGTLMVMAGILILSSKIMPNWVGWLAIAVALANYGFVPTMYFGAEPEKFYSASGLGASLVATLPFLIWIVITSIFMITKRNHRYK